MVIDSIWMCSELVTFKINDNYRLAAFSPRYDEPRKSLLMSCMRLLEPTCTADVLLSTRARYAAEVKSRLASKLGLVRSILDRHRSKLGRDWCKLGRALDGVSRSPPVIVGVSGVLFRFVLTARLVLRAGVLPVP